jgi:hypothetical protein
MAPSANTAGGGPRARRWTRELIIEKVREWNARYGEPPCSADWNPSLARWRAQEWRAERYRAGVWPSTNAAKRHFGGSFDAAVRAAGLEPHRPGPKRGAGTVAAPPPVRPKPVEARRHRHVREHVAARHERRAETRGRVELVADGEPAANAEARRRAAALATRRNGGPSGPAVLAAALKRLARARAAGDRSGLAAALGEVASAAIRWRDRL